MSQAAYTFISESPRGTHISLPADPPTSDMSTIGVVASSRFYLDALSELFKQQRNLQFLGASEYSNGAVERIAASEPAIVVMGPSRQDAQCRTARAIRNALPHTKILMIGMEDEQDSFLAAVQAGAVGYVLKKASSEQIVAAAHELAFKPFVCPSHLLMVLFDYIAMHSPLDLHEANPVTSGDGDSTLTVRESELLSLLDCGLTNKEIAGRLNLSEHTVKNHLHSIFRKTGVTNRLALVKRDPSGRF